MGDVAYIDGVSEGIVYKRNDFPGVGSLYWVLSFGSIENLPDTNAARFWRAPTDWLYCIRPSDGVVIKFRVRYGKIWLFRFTGHDWEMD